MAGVLTGGGKTARVFDTLGQIYNIVFHGRRNQLVYSFLQSKKSISALEIRPEGGVDQALDGSNSDSER